MLAGELAKISGARVNNPNIEIVGVTENSKAVKKGFLFAALEGAVANGEDFIPLALENGAVAVLMKKSRKEPDLPEGFCVFVADEPRLAFTLMVKAFFPKQPENIVAVTGTNGKTSTSVFCRQIWEALGEPAASMGTIGIVSKYMNEEGNLTSPPPTVLYPNVNTLAEKGVRSLAIEASSHGICQWRLDGLKIRAAGFTNLTQDHLDYHKTMDNYFMAKLRLFKELVVPSGMAVINADIPEAAALNAAAKGSKLNILSYGFKGKDLKIVNHRMDARGQNLLLEVLGKRYNIRLPLNGDFQAMNALCALGLCIGTGANIEKAVEALEGLKGAWGRLENVVTLSNGASIYVDYAHTPDAIENVLKTLRPTCSGKLSIVMGCGGDRDRTKRPKMGKISAELADKVFVTDDNPRSEDPATIRAEIMVACPGGVEISPREKAIATAIGELNAGDVLVLAGKGHETGQKIGNEVLHFNDTEEAIKAALAIDPDAREGAGENTAVIWEMSELTKIIGGATKLGNKDVYGVAVSLKDVKPADVFVALDDIGGDSDRDTEETGHSQVAGAFERGAVAAIVHKLGQNGQSEPFAANMVVVDDTMSALDNMAKYARFRGKAKLILLCKNTISEKVVAALRALYMPIGEMAHIYDKRVSELDTKVRLSNVGRHNKFIALELGGANFSKLGDVSKAAFPDVILITAEDRVPNITDAFKGALPDAALLIEDSHRNLAAIIKEAKINGIRRIVTFGLMEDSDVSAKEFGDDRVELIAESFRQVL